MERGLKRKRQVSSSEETSADDYKPSEETSTDEYKPSEQESSSEIEEDYRVFWTPAEVQELMTALKVFPGYPGVQNIMDIFSQSEELQNAWESYGKERCIQKVKNLHKTVKKKTDNDNNDDDHLHENNNCTYTDSNTNTDTDRYNDGDDESNDIDDDNINYGTSDDNEDTMETANTRMMTPMIVNGVNETSPINCHPQYSQ